MRIRLLALVAALAITLPVAPATAAGSRYAPLDRPGPALHVSVKTFKKALLCHGPYVANHKEPVLLIPATGVTPKQNYSWNYERACTAAHRPYCTITMPHSTLEDIQDNGEYLVYAIRRESQMAGRRIAVIGISQGGLLPRFALTYWPDLRTKVTDVLAAAGTQHGTNVVGPAGPCSAANPCPPAYWQQAANSNLLRALNRQPVEAPGPTAWTTVRSATDASRYP